MGGRVVCVTRLGPSSMDWEQFGGNKFRESIGRKLWGSKWRNYLLGGVDEDKVDAVAFIKMARSILNSLSSPPFRDNLLIVPECFLEPHDGELYLPLHLIHKIYVLRAPGANIESNNERS